MSGKRHRRQGSPTLGNRNKKLKYKTGNRAEINRIHTLEKHLKKHPLDNSAKKALIA